jgi:hypothetical protein
MTRISATRCVRIVDLALISVGLLSFVLVAAVSIKAADSSPQLRLDTSKAGPRAVEPLTERAIARDYRNAWHAMDQALESNSPGSIDGVLTGEARQELRQRVAGQQKAGLRQVSTAQVHQVNAVFYAPEGDVIELHDTLTCQRQIFDGDKLLLTEQATRHYVVLMTPTADHWVVRQLQETPQF